MTEDQKKADKRDFDYAICKVPRKDKYGNDATNDKIGKGGRHRSNGTYSAPVEDIQIVDEYPLQKTEVIVKQQPPWYEQIIYDFGCELIHQFSHIIAYKAVDVFTQKYKEWEQKKYQKRIASIKHSSKKSHTSSINSITYKETAENMTSEEAQKEIIEAFVLDVISARKKSRVRQANIVDFKGNIIAGSDLINTTISPYLLTQINTILENNPALLEKWQEKALEEVTGRKIIKNGNFIPLEQQEFITINHNHCTIK